MAAERGTLRKEGRFKVALCYPNSYAVAASSLGNQVIYRLIHARPDWTCERAVFPDDLDAWRASRTPLVTYEGERPVSDFDVIAFSVAFELDVPHVAEMLELSGMPALACERTDRHPTVLAGGPITLSNPLPLGPFIDVAILGDAEEAMPAFLTAAEEATSKADLLERCAALPGFWVPAAHGDRTPDTLKVAACHLPAVGQIVTPHAELSDMFLIEASRGCPRMCSFCVVRATASPMREADPAAVMAAIPAHAKRVGFVGAAVSDYSHIRDVLRASVERGLGVGVSSLRADRLDEELVMLLARGGYRTLTVASDAPSERQRSKIMKGIRERHLLRAAELAKVADLRLVKMYMIIGLPGETDDDLAELIDFCKRLRAIHPMALTLSPFVPKLHTPLYGADFEGIKPIENKLRHIRKALGAQVDVRAASARWAWVEYRLSQGGMDAGIAAWTAFRSGGSFSAWKQAFARCEGGERAASGAALRHGIWTPSSVDKANPRPPRPPRRLRPAASAEPASTHGMAE